MTQLLASILAGTHDTFAVVRHDDQSTLEVYTGHLTTAESIARIPLPQNGDGPAVLAAIPYRQITERGFDCHDDRTPLTCLVIEQREEVPVDIATGMLPDPELGVTGEFALDDAEYARVVRRIVTEEIAHGAGANFVIRRDFTGTVARTHREAALTLLRRLLIGEVGAYWTFAFVTPEFALVGATPERHVSATHGTVVMNPISGTFRHNGTTPTRDDILEFLGDRKETDELFMVVDEELKMMAQVCDRGGRVLGPYLKQMGNLTHTEYLLRGESDLDVRDILRHTMFAPTVTGSPVENAARIIHSYENDGRRYYSGVLALLGHDEHGQTLDAPILIRTCELSAAGEFTASVGATLVRASDPDAEVAETHAKLGGLLQALGVRPARRGNTPPALTDDPDVQHALLARNTGLADFWVDRQPRAVTGGERAGTSALLINMADEWTAMLAHQLRHLGASVEICRWDAVPEMVSADLLVAGPGPGDPSRTGDPRIAALEALIDARLANGAPLLAICLGHQVLARRLGFPLASLSAPNQGTQLPIPMYGREHLAGFYNSFTALAATPPPGVSVSADPHTGVVHALHGPGFTSVQFHPESILTTDGIDLLARLAGHALDTAPGRVPSET